jgi:hypothetical protein
MRGWQAQRTVPPIAGELHFQKKSVCGRSNEHFPNASMARAQLDEINLHVKTEP